MRHLPGPTIAILMLLACLPLSGARAQPTDNPPSGSGAPLLAPGGIFVLSPFGAGLQVEQGGCPRGRAITSVEGNNLCRTGPFQATMDATWENPNATGVFIRLLWKDLQAAPGLDDASFDFSVLDRELDKAARNGKLFSIGIQAGEDGTPDWIFSTEPDGTPRPDGGGGVTRLRLQDYGSDDEPRREGSCGVRMDLGNPTDPAFQQRYFELLTKIAGHISARPDWYAALAYVKPSGANLFTLENRLPKRSNEGCISNPQVFAENGYTPTGLYAFYSAQFALLTSLFPGKAMAYALIQDGFPQVNDRGGWERADGSSSNGLPLPRGTEQTEQIIALGKREQGARFVVQHNGLSPLPSGRRCPNEGTHPARPPFAMAGTGCPNRWVLEAGADGRTITGFQTVNLSRVSTAAQLEAALQNAFQSSDGSFVEIYEEVFWLATNSNGGVLPSGKTIGGWAADFDARRRQLFPNIR